MSENLHRITLLAGKCQLCGGTVEFHLEEADRKVSRAGASLLGGFFGFLAGFFALLTGFLLGVATL